MNDPSSLAPLLEPIRTEMERMEQILHDEVGGATEPLHSVLLRALGGGKRLRAALVLLAGRMFNAPSASFERLAAAVEMLHAATLIHDDVVDDSPLRRGSATLHTVWPVKATILAGDYLLARSTAVVAELDHPPILRVFAEALCTLCAGEIQQMFVTGGRHTQGEDYYRSIEAKTAALFAAAVQMAGMLAAASEAQVAALTRYGRELGMAFQIVDDVLDFVADEATLGKPAGSDLLQGLVTLPVLLYLEEKHDNDPVAAVLAGQRDEEHVQAAVQAIRSSGAIAAALAEASLYARRAADALFTLPDTPARRTLAALAEYIVERRC